MQFISCSVYTHTRRLTDWIFFSNGRPFNRAQVEFLNIQRPTTAFVITPYKCDGRIVRKSRYYYYYYYIIGIIFTRSIFHKKYGRCSPSDSRTSQKET